MNEIPPSTAPLGYRVLHIGADGRIQKPDVVEAVTDSEALRLAWLKLEGLPIEIWRGQRFIGRIDPPRSV